MKRSRSDFPARLVDEDGTISDLLRKVERQSRQAPSEAAAWERTLRRLGRDSGRGRFRVFLAAGAGAMAGAVALYLVLARSAHLRPDATVADSPALVTPAPPTSAVPTPHASPVAAQVGATLGEPLPGNDRPRAVGGSQSTPAVGTEDSPRIQLGYAAIGLPAGRAELLGEAEVTLSRGGQASAFANVDAATVELAAGEIELRVAKRPAEARHVFSVMAGSYRFTVLGTAFSVARANGKVTLSVTEGRVAVSKNGEFLTVVTAGGFWASSARATHATSRGIDPPRAPEDERVNAFRPVSVSMVAELPRLERRPRAARDDRGAVETRPSPIPAPTAPSGAEAPARVTPPPLSSLADAAAQPRAATGASSYVPAGCGGRAAVPRSRLDCLLARARGSDLEAEVSLYEAARLYRDAFGDTSQAVATLHELTRRFPSGALAAEAALSLAEWLPASGRYREALAASASVLRTRPTADRLDEMHLLRGDLMRSGLGDCRSALIEYSLAAKAPRDLIADPATFFGAVCLQQLGDGPGARRSFESYLARPRPRRAAEAQRRLRELGGGVVP